MKTYYHLNKWKLPPYYMGLEYPNSYSAGVGQSRDSDALERSNFDSMAAALEGCDGWKIIRDNHWAVGWVEWIAITDTADKALTIADAIMGYFADYPVIDEDRYSAYEDEECAQTWEHCFDQKERAEYMRKHNISFACWRDLRRAVQDGCWYQAARMLDLPL